MADERERDEREQAEGSKIKVVDRRMLNDDERSGKGSIITPGNPTPGAESAPPKLEIISGGSNLTADDEAVAAIASDALEDDVFEAGDETGDEMQSQSMMGDDAPMTEAEQEEMRQALEEEQFQAIEQRVGRPLTEKEKDAVRQQMEAQAQSVMSLEIAPVLAEVMVKMPQYAAVHLGLVPNPYTQIIARNDAQAKLAIDAFSALLDVLRPQLEPRGLQEFDRVLNDLRANFTQITGIAATGKPSGPRIIH